MGLKFVRRRSVSSTGSATPSTYASRTSRFFMRGPPRESKIVDRERYPREPKMAIGRPASPDAIGLHEVHTDRVGQSQILIGKPSQDILPTFLFPHADPDHVQWPHLLE